ncbi:hypothetical protein HAX54_019649, partial [Datura stramonium]|nr:hypothetical protein [Datura stramonium]
PAVRFPLPNTKARLREEKYVGLRKRVPSSLHSPNFDPHLSEVKWLSLVGATGLDDIDSRVSVVRYTTFCLGLGRTYLTGTNRKARPESDDTSKYLISRQAGQKLLITRRLLQSFRCQPIGRDLTLSLLYEYAYKSTANPFEQDSCKLGSVVLEGD